MATDPTRDTGPHGSSEPTEVEPRTPGCLDLVLLAVATVGCSLFAAVQAMFSPIAYSISCGDAQDSCDYSNDWFVAPLVLGTPVLMIGASLVLALIWHQRGRPSFYWPVLALGATEVVYLVAYLLLNG